jgi:peroxiredoxin
MLKEGVVAGATQGFHREDDMAVTLGQPVREWELPSLENPSRLHRLSDYRGRLVVQLFWAATCPMCRRYNSYLDGFAATYHSKGAILLGISSSTSDTPDRVRLVLRNQVPQFPILRDADGAVARAFGVTVTPTVYVLDREGVLRYWGAIDDRTPDRLWPATNYLEEVVDRLLLERDLPDPHNPPVGTSLRLPAAA